MTSSEPSAMRRNPWLLCGARAAMMSLFPMAILTVFLQRRVGFSMSDIMVLQGAFGLAMALFEFPSGYLADRIGYRRCLLWAYGLWILAWPIYGFSEGWMGVIVAELLLGVGMSLVSGCDTALMYESLLASGREAEFARWSGRQTFSGQAAEGTAALVAGVLFALGPMWPFLVQAGAATVGLVLVWYMVEPERERPGFGDGLAQIRGMVGHVRSEAPLRALFVAAIVLSLASFVPVWTIQLYALESGVPEPWLGPLWAAANFSVALAALLSHRIAGRMSMASVVAGGTVLAVIGFAGLGSVHAIWGFAFYYFLTVMRGLQSPAIRHAEQRLVPSRDRAGFVSMRSMAFRVTFLLVGPAVGWGVDHHGQHPVMSTLAVGFAVAGLLAFIGIRRAFPGRRSGPSPA